MSQNVAKDFREVNKAEAALEFLADTRSEAVTLREKQAELIDQVARVNKTGTWAERNTVIQGRAGLIGYSEAGVNFEGTQFIPVDGTPYSVALQERIGNRETLVKHTHLLVHKPKDMASSFIDEDDIHSFAVFETSAITIDGLDAPTLEALEAVQQLVDYIEASPEK